MAARRHSFVGGAGPAWSIIGREGTRATCSYLKRRVQRTGKGGGRRVGGSGRRWSKGWQPVLRGAMILAAFAVVFTLPPARADVDPATVQRSIDRGIAFLKKTQNDRGGWSEFRSQSCGLSALCTLALLNAGVERDDPAMVRALRYLRGFEPEETYSVALQTLVYCQAGAAGDLPRIRKNVEWLIAAQQASGNRAGAWTYSRRGPGGGDPSNSQFAVLALGAAVDRGVEVEPEVFREAANYWQRRQKRSGGWSYFADQPTGSMTCAGIGSLIIAQGRLDDAGERIAGAKVECCGDDQDRTDAVRQGLEFLGRRFSVQSNPGDSFNFYYYLYALERVGRLSGRRFIGGHDWYREGAERLIELQDNFQGFWSGANVESDQNIATAFALLFLSKGKRQVVLGRLQYGEDPSQGDWQRHPDALRQLVRHVERDWRRDLTWQTIDGDRASVEDLLQAPVLVIGGTGPLDLDSALVERLGDYLNQGGSILFDGDGAEGCGDAAGFERSVHELCSEWFDGAELEKLPPTHPVWFAEHRVDPTALGDEFWIEGVQACCRTAVFYAPRSLSCRWQLGGELFRRSEANSGARTEVESSIRVGENIIAYATGRELKDKLEQRTVLRTGSLEETDRGVIPIAQLELGAGGEDARRALPNAVELVRARVPIEIAAARDPVGFDRQSLHEVPVLWIHGRTDFELQPAERAELEAFVSSGGFVIGSAICGSEAFSEAFRREIGQALAEKGMEKMRPDHPALTEAFGGFDVRTVSVRTPEVSDRSLTLTRRDQAPRLERGAVAGMDAIFFSPLDISCALESQNAVECPGYDTEDAAKIVANLLLYALQQ